MKVLVIGGTGFLGYHSTVKFRELGHSVTTLSVPDLDLSGWFPEDVEVLYHNVFELDASALQALFAGYDALVYAVGPDDRERPRSDPYTFFHQRLVEAPEQIVLAARRADIAKCVVLGSYFAHFDRLQPERGLAARHPYIRCRVEQGERLIAAGDGDMAVCVLELPYIFGSMPGRVPLWKDVIVRMLLERNTIYYPRGGSAMVTVDCVAAAVAGAALRGEHGKYYPVGADNLPWTEMIRVMLDAMDMGHKRIVTIPDWVSNATGYLLKARERWEGFHSGLDLRYLFPDIMTQFLYLDPATTCMELGYERGDVRAAIADAARVSLANLLQERENS